VSGSRNTIKQDLLFLLLVVAILEPVFSEDIFSAIPKTVWDTFNTNRDCDGGRPPGNGRVPAAVKQTPPASTAIVRSRGPSRRPGPRQPRMLGDTPCYGMSGTPDLGPSRWRPAAFTLTTRLHRRTAVCFQFLAYRPYNSAEPTLLEIIPHINLCSTMRGGDLWNPNSVSSAR
jgi:hypothetical protein